MTDLQILESLNEAIKILGSARRNCANGSMTIWRIVDHAQKHLDKQIARHMLIPAEEGR